MKENYDKINVAELL